ncbi:MAG: hydroxyacid dehydrogenase [Verrucomicrobiaceae bacterium]|nr:MAG: hydroxyacid dehydrogenase [Verrucomicrobiaceae bacterium]
MNFYFVATEPAEEAFFREALPECELRFVSDLTEVEADVEGMSIFIQCCVDAAFLENHPKLRMVTTRSGAVDHIDLQACRSRGVTVGHVPVYGETTVAEHTFALILALSRRLREVMAVPAQGQFSYAGARGFDLAGKTLGVVGMGHIGQRVARFGHCFSMRVLAYDPIEMSADFAEKHKIEWASLENLLREAHVVTLHVLLSPVTRHILNRETLALCRPGVLIVNTARGGLIDTMALMEALDSGHIGGVGLDVLEDERVLRKGATDIISAEIVKHLQEDASPEQDQVHRERRVRDLQELMVSHSMLTRPNVVFTPHVAFNSVEAVERLNTVTVENIRAFLAGKPQNVP